MWCKYVICNVNNDLLQNSSNGTVPVKTLFFLYAFLQNSPNVTHVPVVLEYKVLFKSVEKMEICIKGAQASFHLQICKENFKITFLF